MRTVFSLKIILLFVILVILSSRTKAQDDLGRPAPIKNASMEMMMGTWKSDPYDFFGSKWTDVATHSMKYNGQYMFIDLNGSDDKGHSFTGGVFITADKDGNITGWGFDDWGGVTTYTGKSDGNKVTVNGKGAMGTETRVITINGNTMVHESSMTMAGKDGKDMTMKLTITYHKQ
jgi:hypothetical protein